MIKVANLLLLILVIFVVKERVLANEEKTSPPLPAKTNRITPVVKTIYSVLPSVVNIVARKYLGKEDHNNTPTLRENTDQSQYSLGAGCVISENGLILTNFHVIDHADWIEVTIHNGEKYIAHVIACDIKNDLALLQILQLTKQAHLQPINLADVNDLLLGETVVAIGNPYGLGESVSVGILSGTNRKIVHKGQLLFNDILQTDAAINPGNSGGPLLNLDNQVIGINTSNFDSAHGIGFAIPVSRIQNFLVKCLIPETLGCSYMGFVAKYQKIDELNCYAYAIQKVYSGSPADLAGIKEGEIVLKINEIPVNQILKIGNQLTTLKPGESISMTLAHDQKRVITAGYMGNAHAEQLLLWRLGFGGQTMTPALAKNLSYPMIQGVLVNDLSHPIKGIQRGYLITQLNGTMITNVNDLINSLKKIPSGTVVDIGICTFEKKDESTILEKYIVQLLVK